MPDESTACMAAYHPSSVVRIAAESAAGSATGGVDFEARFAPPVEELLGEQAQIATRARAREQRTGIVGDIVSAPRQEP